MSISSQFSITFPVTTVQHAKSIAQILAVPLPLTQFSITPASHVTIEPNFNIVVDDLGNSFDDKVGYHATVFVKIDQYLTLWQKAVVYATPNEAQYHRFNGIKIPEINQAIIDIAPFVFGTQDNIKEQVGDILVNFGRHEVDNLVLGDNPANFRIFNDLIAQLDTAIKQTIFTKYANYAKVD